MTTLDAIKTYIVANAEKLSLRVVKDKRTIHATYERPHYDRPWEYKNKYTGKTIKGVIILDIVEQEVEKKVIGRFHIHCDDTPLCFNGVFTFKKWEFDFHNSQKIAELVEELFPEFRWPEVKEYGKNIYHY